MAEFNEDKSQQEAVEKTEVPAVVVDDQEKQKQDAADARGKHLQFLNDHKDLANKYGEPDFAHLLLKVGSDSVFAQNFVQDILTNEETFNVSLSPDSPQENNVTGKLDHTGDVATKLKA